MLNELIITLGTQKGHALHAMLRQTYVSWWLQCLFWLQCTVLAKHHWKQIGQMNGNSQLLLSLCREQSTITNMPFQLPNIHKAMWTHPNSKHWHLIDFIIRRCWDIQDVCITRVMRGADCWTEHMLLRSKLLFHIFKAKRWQGVSMNRKLYINKCDTPECRQTFQTISKLPGTFKWHRCR